MLLRILYAHDLLGSIGYMHWTLTHPAQKAGAVLDPTQPPDWWWLEDRLENGEMKAITAAGLAHRYIEVQALGPWGFADACLELFRRASITDAMIERHGDPRIFRKEHFLDPQIILPDEIR